MSTTRLSRFTLLAVILAFAASACGGDESSDPGTDNKPAVSAAPSPADDAITTEDDVTVQALEAVGATEVEVSADEVRAHFAGSVDDATAWTYCSAMQMLSGPRSAIVVYSDGELDCADRRAG